MMKMMMVQSCQSIDKAPPSLSPALHPPDQQQSFKQKPQNFSRLSFCCSVLRFSGSYFFISLSSPPPLLHSRTPLYSVQQRVKHTRTNEYQQFVVNKELSVLIQCVCWGRWGLYNCPLTGGGEVFFQSNRIYFIHFLKMSPFPLSISVICHLTWTSEEASPAPAWYVTPSSDTVQRPRPPHVWPNCLTEPEPVRWELGRPLSLLSLCLLLPPSPFDHPLLRQSSQCPFCFYFERVCHSPAKCETFEFL